MILIQSNRNIFEGGDGLSLFETRPLEDILADIGEGWHNTQLRININKSKLAKEIDYVL